MQIVTHGHARLVHAEPRKHAGYVDGLPIFTGPMFGWGSSDTGLLLAVLGLASLPVSAVVGYLSTWLKDRALVSEDL